MHSEKKDRETDEIIDMLVDHEARRYKVYDDKTGRPLKKGDTIQGHPTIGIGRNLHGLGLSDDEIDYLVMNDLVRTYKALDKYLPWWRDLSKLRMRVMIDMCFNMGISRFLGFRKMLGAAMAGDYEIAADEMIDSDWANQVPVRADELQLMMRVGG